MFAMFVRFLEYSVPSQLFVISYTTITVSGSYKVQQCENAHVHGHG